RAARDSGQPEPSLEPVSTALVNFCLRAVGAPVCEEPS
ncbi:TetR/AcrR family transcriptional regulator, partial [Pseudomonas aeruginosa]